MRSSTVLVSLAIAMPVSLAAQATAPLQLYWNARRGDNYVVATPEGRTSATRAGYGLIRVEGCVFASVQPGTVPLYQYWSATRGDNFATTAEVGGKGQSNDGGYVLIRTEGYVFSAPAKGTQPLSLFYNSQRHDNYTTATTAGADAARHAGYALVGVVGYVFPPDHCRTP